MVSFGAWFRIRTVSGIALRLNKRSFAPGVGRKVMIARSRGLNSCMYIYMYASVKGALRESL